MTRENSRPEHPRQAAFCETHQLRFDPVRPGCPLCMRNLRSSQGGPVPILLIAGATLVIAAAGLWFLLPSDSEAPPEVIVTLTSPIEEVEFKNPELIKPRPLDPIPYQQEIRAIESILYQMVPPSPSDVSMLRRAGEALHGKILESGQNPSMRRQAAEILYWGNRLSLESEIGYAAPSFVNAREEWEAARGQVFESAPWFRTSNSRIEAAQRPPPPVFDRALVSRLQGVAADLRRLISTAKSEARAIGEILGEAVTPEVRRIRREWEAWSPGWQERVDEVASRMPAQPELDSDLSVTMAYQQLGAALHQLRLVSHSANDFGIPFQSERDDRFEAAGRLLEEALDYLAVTTH